MRLIIGASIDNRTHCIDLLEHRAGKSLSKCRTGKFCFTHGICRMNNTWSLIWKIDSRAASKVEQCLCLQELFCSHFCCYLHHRIITGICNNIPQCLCTMRIRPYRTLDIRITIRTKRLATITDKSICFWNLAFFQCSRHNDRLHNRSRFICLSNTEVTPHGIQRRHCIFITHCRNFFFGILAGKISRIIQIIAVPTIHGNDLTGRWLHCDHTDIFCSHGFFKSINIFFNNLLYTHIQGCYNTLSVFRIDDRLFHICIVIDISILTAIRPHQRTVIVTLQSYVCRISGKCKSNRIICKLIKRITSQIIFFKPYPFYICPLCFLCIWQLAVFSRRFIIFKSFFLIHGELLLQDLILAVLRILGGKDRPNLVFIKSQHVCQCSYCRFYIFFIRVDGLAVKDHRIHFLTCRQDITVTVINISSFRWKSTALILLLCLCQNLLFVFFATGSINISNSAQ